MSGAKSDLLPIIVKKTFGQHFWLLIGSLIVVLLGIQPLLNGNSSVSAWTLVLTFGFSALYHYVNVVNSKPYLLISKDGINADYWNSSLIWWSDLSSAEVRIIGRGVFLCLTLRDPEAFRRRIGFLQRGVHSAGKRQGLGDLSVELSRFRLDTAVVVALVQQQIDSAKANPKHQSSVRYPDID